VPWLALAFLFRLSAEETRALNDVVGSAGTQKHRDPRNPPFAFTEHGAMMLAMVLKSSKAIEMSVYVVRAFASLREAARSNALLVERLHQLEGRIAKHDGDIAAILAAIRELVAPPKRPSRGIGFLADIKSLR
jgi:hypothetical protein